MKGVGDFDYDRGGHGYARQRQPDPRIARVIHAALGEAATVLNVGAGAGSYEPEGRWVLALEPSAVMRAQRPEGAAPALDGRAEALPFDDGSFEAAMGVYTVHQWADLDLGLKELRRVTRGPVVIVAGDGDRLADFWLNAYAPTLIAAERRRYPAISHIAGSLGGRVEIAPIPIPFDCADGFTEAFYGRPERLLEPQVRAAQSSWAFAGPGAETAFVEQLGADLASGAWDAAYGALRSQAVYTGSLTLIVSRP